MPATDKTGFSGPDAARRAKAAAFTLVEVTLALGIFAFAFLGIFGLLPLGLQSHRAAIDLTVGGQIAQQVINEALQTDFDVLVTNNGQAPDPTQPATVFQLPVRYFDLNGRELTATAGGSVPGSTLYQVNTRVEPTTTMPGTAVTAQINPNLATVVVQVVNNPGHQPLQQWPGSATDSTKPLRLLWNGQHGPGTGTNPGFGAVLTRSTLVARNRG